MRVALSTFQSFSTLTINKWCLCPTWFPKDEEIGQEITAKHLSNFSKYNLFNPHNTYENKYYYKPHFTDEKLRHIEIK